MKFNLVVLFFISALQIGVGQEITTEIDEFTGDKKVVTEWEVYSTTFAHAQTFYRFRSVNDRVLFELKFTKIDYKSYVPRDGELLIKTESGEIIKLMPIDRAMAEVGGGAIGLSGSEMWGIYAKYDVTRLQLREILTDPIDKIRIYLNDSYTERELPKKKKAKMSNLIEKFLNQS